MVVVSAMGKETDRLLSLTDDLDKYDRTDDLASLLSSGEQISSSLFSILLNKNNIKSKSFQGWQLPILTELSAYNAHIVNVETKQNLSLGSLMGHMAHELLTMAHKLWYLRICAMGFPQYSV